MGWFKRPLLALSSDDSLVSLRFDTQLMKLFADTLSITIGIRFPSIVHIRCRGG